ncbi:GntR family transcriptional regulator [Teichococcus vastitatis]|uniref:GntR family transcriptional regulator n=1 Tax=Teichococcus vastitatis TaxID=2307076 RepID=A0ABS9W163_9PROT|nr:GntR family transcriptional regulator [Pseudoroseomonas vastitatis]MCI0753042.1 GntR family transcriptional regulator [Pseudoroseomonas vastitatis]
MTVPLSSKATSLLQPIGRRQSAAGFAYEALRAAILALELSPGASLSRALLAARLGISQTPVREALIRLESEGLVEVVPSASTRVALIDLRNAREALFLRRAVELELVRSLAQDPSATLRHDLHDSLEQQGLLVASGDHDGLVDADALFHVLLYQAGGIGSLWTLVSSRSGHLDRLRRLHLPSPGKAAAILEDHQALAGAILAGRADHAEAVLRRHLTDTLAHLSEIRAAYPGYFAADAA